MTARIAPSILSSDFANLESELARIDNADFAHVDVMDGHFVPNLTLGTPVVEALVRAAPVPIDVHLMIEAPDRWALGYAEAGAASVTFHAEAVAAPIRLARELRAQGVRAGLAVKPATAIEPYLELLDEFDMLLVMTVEPGFGGQKFLSSCLPKVTRAREAVQRHGGDIWVQVDGGISVSTIGQCAEAGADMFVAGSAVYGAVDAAEMVQSLRDIAMSHMH